jgi:GAF domain-containing protein
MRKNSLLPTTPIGLNMRALQGQKVQIQARQQRLAPISTATDVDDHSELFEDIAKNQIFLQQLPAIMSLTDVIRVMDAASSFIMAECVSLFLVSDDDSTLVCISSKNQKAIGKEIPRADGIMGYVAQSGRMINIIDPATDWRYHEASDAVPGVSNLRSLLIMPVRSSQGKLLGLIQAINCTNEAPASGTMSSVGFSDDDESIMQIFSRCVSSVVESKNMECLLSDQQKQTNALHQIVGLNNINMEESKKFNQHASEAIRKIVRACYMICHCEHVTLYMIDESKRQLVSTSKYSKIPTIDFRNAGLSAFVATSGQTVNCADTACDLRFDANEDYRSGHNTYTMLVVPIKEFSGKTVALLKLCNRLTTEKRVGTISHSVDTDENVDSERARRRPSNVIAFSAADQRMVESLAVTASGCLTHARLFEEAISRKNQTESLLRINQLMQAETATDKIIPKIIESAYDLISAERISLFTMQDTDLDAVVHAERIIDQFDNKEKRTLLCQVSADKTLEGKRFPWGSGIVGTVARTQKTININDAYSDDRFNKQVDLATNFRTRNILTVPILDWKFKCVGVLQAVNKINEDHFTNDDVANLEHLATSAGIVLRKSALYESAVSAQKKVKTLMAVQHLVSNSRATIGQVLDELVTLVRNSLSGEYAHLFFVDHASQVYFSLNPDLRFSFSLSASGAVAHSGTIVNIASTSQDPRHDSSLDAKLGFITETLLICPVRDTDGLVIAMIRVANKRHQEATNARDSMGLPTTPAQNTTPALPFSRDDEELLDAVCAHIRPAIRRFLGPALRVLHKSEDSSILDMYSSPEENAVFANHSFEPKKEEKRMEPKPKMGWFFHPVPSPDAAQNATRLRLLCESSFNVWEHSEDDLMEFTILMFKDMGLLESPVVVDLPVLQAFVLGARNGYRANPFHNWRHGFSTCHFTYLTCKKFNVGSFLEPLDQIGLMIAALTHDLDHPGNTNKFEIDSISELAILHNDIHVLENHHASMTFQLLKKHNVFANLSSKQYREIRSLMIGAILATDLADHTSETSHLAGISLPDDLNRVFDVHDPKQRKYVCNLVIHSSDLSAQTGPLPIAVVWEQKISLEFQAQAARERERGLQPLEFMENLTDPYRRAQLQVGFIRFVLLPWWTAMARVFPGLKPALDQLASNCEQYGLMAKRPEGTPATVNTGTVSVLSLPVQQ